MRGRMGDVEHEVGETHFLRCQLRKIHRIQTLAHHIGWVVPLENRSPARMGFLTVLMLVAVFLFFAPFGQVYSQLPAHDLAQEDHTQHNAHVEAHWAYHGIEGPDHWAMLSPHFSSCETGVHQSPVNINATRY